MTSHQLSAGAAGQPAPGGHRRGDPGPSGRGGGGGDRVGEDDPAAQDLPGAGPRHAGDDRPHPAAAAGRPDRGRAGRGRAAHHAGPDGRLPGPLHRPGRKGHPGQADDRRHPAGRAGTGPVPAPLRHDHHRRGPRAQPQRRLPARLPGPAAAPPARPQADHHLGHHRPRALQPPLRRRPGGRGVRPHLPGRGPLPAAGGRRRRRPGPDPGDPGRGRRAVPRGPWRHPGVPQRRAGDPRHRRGPARPPASRGARAGWTCCRCTPGWPPPSSTACSRPTPAGGWCWPPTWPRPR